MKTPAVLLALLALALPTRAHRLDEYLQATRLALTREHLELRFDLTPGVAVFPELLPAMDSNHDGRISKDEQTAYAKRLLQDCLLELDGHKEPIQFRHLIFPSREDMAAGEGVIHLTAVVGMGTLRIGPHEIHFRNDHLPKLSVYLVNALVPESKEIRITRQIRDVKQREYRLQFQVTE